MLYKMIQESDIVRATHMLLISFRFSGTCVSKVYSASNTKALTSIDWRCTMWARAIHKSSMRHQSRLSLNRIKALHQCDFLWRLFRKEVLLCLYRTYSTVKMSSRIVILCVRKTWRPLGLGTYAECSRDHFLDPVRNKQCERRGRLYMIRTAAVAIGDAELQW